MSKVITFFGGEPKTGTTMITQSVAEALSKKGQKVLVIFASCEYGDLFIPQTEWKDAPTIEYIKGAVPQKSDIKRLIGSHNGYDYILGTSNMLSVPFFDEDTLNDVVKKIEGDYDKIIIDGGNNCYFPLPTAALYAAGKRYFVIVPSNRSVERLENLKILIETAMKVTKTRRLGKTLHGLSADEIILNKYTENSAVTSDIVKNKFSLPVKEVPRVQNGSFAEATNKTLYVNQNKSFVDAINEIANEM